MVCYKIDYKVLRAAGMKDEDGFRTFCGADLRHPTNVTDLHFVGPHLPRNQPVVNCPTCVAIYQAIVNHHLDTKGN